MTAKNKTPSQPVPSQAAWRYFEKRCHNGRKTTKLDKCDCMFTVNGVRNQRWRVQLAKHDVLWREVGELRHRNITVKWTKAHGQPKHVRTGQAQLAHALGNAIADKVA